MAPVGVWNFRSIAKPLMARPICPRFRHDSRRSCDALRLGHSACLSASRFFHDLHGCPLCLLSPLLVAQPPTRGGLAPHFKRPIRRLPQPTTPRRPRRSRSAPNSRRPSALRHRAAFAPVATGPNAPSRTAAGRRARLQARRSGAIRQRFGTGLEQAVLLGRRAPSLEAQVRMPIEAADERAATGRPFAPARGRCRPCR